MNVLRPLSHWKLISKLICKFMLISSFRKKISSVNSQLLKDMKRRRCCLHLARKFISSVKSAQFRKKNFEIFLSKWNFEINFQCEMGTKKLKKRGPDRSSTNKYLSFGEKIAKIGPVDPEIIGFWLMIRNKKHLKNVGPIRHCEPPHAHSPGLATGTVARHLRIDVHDDNDDNDNDNAWQRGPLWPHRMGPKKRNKRA